VKNIVDLQNNYYFKIINDINDLPDDVTDIEELKVIHILKKERFLLKIDFNKLSKLRLKKTLKKLLPIKKRVLKSKTKFGVKENSKILLGYILNYDENSKEQNDFVLGINAILYNTRYERYNYIYDTACNYLDSFFYGKNLCDFKNNKCGEKSNTSSTIGCCHHFKIKFLGPLTKLVPCEHLKEDYTCGAKCLGCKLFTCDYLQKKGIKFKIKDILLLDTFFNPLQKIAIKCMVFTPKEKIIKRLMIL